MSGDAHARRERIHLDEGDPLPPEPWREASSPGIRRMALQACKAAVEASRDRRKKPIEEVAE